ncbi:MAG TPA: GntR family transcriptional regulator [Clostridiales bacterium]|jgi:GntR family transcriptional regulator|nr:GntR family transcriptional regulator [Clostridiales bacterium]
MLQIDRFSQTPIYEQVISQMEHLISSGILPTDTPLPSVRSLSQELQINPNTLQKAYAELERRGHCYSVPGTGRFVAAGAAEALQKARAEEALSEITLLGRRLNSVGVPLEKAQEALTKGYTSHNAPPNEE